MSRAILDITEYSSVFITGGVLYGAIEICFRGHTHWTMLVTGGLCLSCFHYICKLLKSKNIIIKCLAGCIIITFFEFIAGCIVNLIFELGVWDYSNRYLNLLGQICPLFSLFWFILCIPATALCKLIDNFFSKLKAEKII